MKIFRWNEQKNIILKQERDVSFEEILVVMEEGWILDVLEHINKKKYPNQKIFIVAYSQYIYLIPFIETADEIFLKTIIPSRKATKQYLIDK